MHIRPACYSISLHEYISGESTCVTIRCSNPLESTEVLGFLNL